MLKVESLVVSNAQENTYVIYNEAKEALIIDPGDEAHRIIEWVKRNGWKLQAVLITHAHPDHVMAVDPIREEFGIEAYIHPIEKDMFIHPMQLFAPNTGVENRPADHYWQEMGKHKVGSFEFEVAFLPGHSPGHVVYIFPEDELVISGDTLFAGSIGRTDFPGGSYQVLMEGVAKELLTLPHHFTLYPGHGPKTTIAEELASNPFLDVFRQ